MKGVEVAASREFDARSAAPYHALVHGFPEYPAGSIADVLGQASASTSCVVRRSVKHGVLAVLRFESIEAARAFRARWEGQRFPSAPVDRFEPGTGAPDRHLCVRNGAQQLFAASLHGQREGVELLLEAGVSPNSYRDEFGCTALHMAARSGATAIAKRLVDARADIDAPSALGRTPLAEASAQQHAPIVELLLAAGARVAHLDRWGRHAALAGVCVPECADEPWGNDADKRVAQMLLCSEQPTAAHKREAVAQARLAAAATQGAILQREREARATAQAQSAQAALALDGFRRREVELRRAVDPTVPQQQGAHSVAAALAGGGAAGGGANGQDWLARVTAQAAADARANAPGGAERIAARAAGACADAMQRALWVEGMRSVNPEAGRYSLYPRSRPPAGDLPATTVAAADEDEAERERARRISELGAARANAIREAGMGALAARQKEWTALELELGYINPLKGARASKSFIQPANDLVWCERDGWVEKGAHRVNRAAYLKQ